MQPQLRLNNTERALLSCLQRRGFATWDNLIDDLFAHRADGGPTDPATAVCVVICHLRKKLKAAGVRLKIENEWGRGYRLVCQ